MGLLDGMFGDKLSLDKLMSNPAFQAGLGILSANGSVPSYGKAGPIIGQGLSSGLQNAQAYRQAQSQEQMQRMAMQQKQAEYEQKKAEQERSRQFAEQFRQQMMGGAPISGQGNLQGAGGVPAGQGPAPIGGGGYPYGMTAEQYQFAQQLPPEQLQGFVSSIVKTNTGAAKGELGMFDELRRRGEIPQGMTFTEWKRANARAGASTTSVNQYGTSFTPALDANGNPVFLQPSKGGGPPAVTQGFTPMEQGEKWRQEREGKGNTIASLQVVENNIDELLKHPGLPRAVGGWSAIPSMPGSQAAGAESKIKQLASQAAARAIQDMREASKTGGAVGSVSEAEWPKLEAQLANLERAQSYDEFVASLTAFKAQAQYSRRRIEAAMQAIPGNRQKMQRESMESGTQPQTQQSIATPTGTNKSFELDGGGSVQAELYSDGNYYVIRNGKRFMVQQ